MIMPSVKFILGFLGVIIVTYFALYNMRSVTIQYYFGLHTITIPLSFAIFGAFVVGFVVSGVIRAVKQIGMARQMRRCRKTERRLEEEVRALRERLEHTSRLALEAAHGPGVEESSTIEGETTTPPLSVRSTSLPDA